MAIKDIISLGIGFGGTPSGIITRGLSIHIPDVFVPVQAWSADGGLVQWSASADKVVPVEWSADGGLVEWSA